ncbi:MAG: 50S ribosomal protein L11 methyltransferase [Thermoplasmata archaeon]|nr:50S ribosomal protein L11 methyltransferase [Thermoplasmata archaeon]
MRQRDLEIKLQKLDGFKDPKAHLEQYSTPAKVAADILYTAHAFGDIEGKSVIDLGCGAGIFSIGACLLGADNVLGCDIDSDIIDIARKNAESVQCPVNFDCMPVEEASGEWETCIMNPPFGAQKKHADLPFLDKAMKISNVIYSLHNTGTLPFLSKRIEKTGLLLDLKKSYKFEIRHTFEFHRKEKAEISVTLLRIVKQ